MAFKGLKNEEIVGTDENRKTIIQKKHQYTSIDKLEVRRQFDYLCNKGIIIEGEFSADKWVLLDRYKDFLYTLDFSMLKYRKELKAFCISLLKEDQPSTVFAHFRLLKRIIENTDGFKKNAESYLKENYYTTDKVGVVEEFLEFVGKSAAETRQFRILLSKYARERTVGSRPLPNFQSILLFDRLIDMYASTELAKQTKYYPIVLWWKFTMIIPSRPIEFFQLKEDDFYCNDSRYMVHLVRSLKSGKTEEEYSIPLITEYEITREVYELFQRYISTINVGREGFIFNCDGISPRYPREFIGRKILENLRKEFYKEVICGKYGYKVIEKNTVDYLEEGQIESINYGDTRHLAFLNMILSGYNPYTIAQLGGHRELVTQNLYYSGLTTYCTSKAYSLAFGIIELANTNALAMANWRKNELMRITADLTKAIKIDGGYCTSENFPHDCCTMNCSKDNCMYYLSDNADEIAERKQKINIGIKKKAEILRALIYNPYESPVREETVNELQEDIIKLAHLLQNEKLIKKGSK